MFDTMEEIYENEYLRALVRDCRRYDMPGIFIEHNLGIQSKESGIYFVTGIDREAVYKYNFNPAKALIEQGLNSRKYHPIKVFKITNENPSEVSYGVQSYCWKSEFIDNVFPKFSIRNIDKIPDYTIYYLSYLYKKTHDNEYNDFMRFHYKTLFRKRMLNLQKVQNQKGFSGRYRDYEFSRIFNDEESRLMNIIKYFFRNRQKTSLKFLQREYGGIRSMLIEKRIYKKFIQNLKKHPNVLYSVDKRVLYKEFSTQSCREDAYGIKKRSKIKKRCPCYQIAFPKEAVPIISGIIDDIEFTPYAPTTAEEIVNCGKEWDALTIPQQDMLSYEQQFYKNNITYAIDTGYANHSDYSQIPIVFLKEDKEKVDNICKDIINSGSIYHRVVNGKSITDAGIAKIYYNYDLPKKPSEIKKEQEPSLFKNKKQGVENEYDYIK